MTKNLQASRRRMSLGLVLGAAALGTLGFVGLAHASDSPSTPTASAPAAPASTPTTAPAAGGTSTTPASGSTAPTTAPAAPASAPTTAPSAPAAPTSTPATTAPAAPSAPASTPTTSPAPPAAPPVATFTVPNYVGAAIVMTGPHNSWGEEPSWVQGTCTLGQIPSNYQAQITSQSPAAGSVVAQGTPITINYMENATIPGETSC